MDEPREEMIQSTTKFAPLLELFEIYQPEGALVWLFHPHPQLDGETPASRIEAGDIDSVTALIDQLGSGAFV
jgi:uncharacterized protein (DUF2384 family)